MTDRVVALLPMKDHSERVAGKNMRPFAGRPLYHAVMRQLLASRGVERVVVNTDSERIAEDVDRHFASVAIVMRPQTIRGDFVSMNQIIAYDIDYQPGEHFLQTHSTNPLLTATTIDRAIGSYFAALDRHDALAAVTRIQARLYFADGRPINHDGTGALLRTQDLPAVMKDASTLYIFSRSSFGAAGNNRMGINPLLFEMGSLEAMDIDEEEDFFVTEACYQAIRTGECAD